MRGFLTQTFRRQLKILRADAFFFFARTELSKSNYGDAVLNVPAAHFHIRRGPGRSYFWLMWFLGGKGCAPNDGMHLRDNNNTKWHPTPSHAATNWKHTQMCKRREGEGAGGEMRWMRGSKWSLIDALHPLFHYLQARLIIPTSRDSKVESGCRIRETNTKREPRIANGPGSVVMGWSLLRVERAWRGVGFVLVLFGVCNSIQRTLWVTCKSNKCWLKQAKPQMRFQSWNLNIGALYLGGKHSHETSRKVQNESQVHNIRFRLAMLALAMIKSSYTFILQIVTKPW